MLIFVIEKTKLIPATARLAGEANSTVLTQTGLELYRRHCTTYRHDADRGLARGDAFAHLAIKSAVLA